MLYNGSDVIRDLEWVIFDEVHYINDAEVSLLSYPGFEGHVWCCLYIILFLKYLKRFLAHMSEAQVSFTDPGRRSFVWC